MLGFSDVFAPGDRTLTVQIPLGRARTLYARTGDAFAWLCVAVLIITLVTTMVLRTRSLVESPRGFVYHDHAMDK